MRTRHEDLKATILELAADQHGVVSRSQLMKAGFPGYAMDNRVRNGRFVSLHKGVYRVVGPVRSELEREMAAVLACGQGSLLSHHSAARVMGLASATGQGSRQPPHVSTPGRHTEVGAGVVVHRVRPLAEDERAVARGIPTTSAARTILDLAPSLGQRGVERLLARAEGEGLATVADVERVVHRHPGRRGIRAVRSVLALEAGPALTRSGAEDRMLDIVRQGCLPEPRTNARVAGFEVDFLWESYRVVVEVDGYAYHSSRRMFDRDRQRDRALQASGYKVLRFTLVDLTERRDRVLVQTAQALVPR